jgi:hypothetical protein
MEEREINDSLMYKTLKLVKEKDELFMILDDGVITLLVVCGFVIIEEKNALDMSKVYLTERGEKTLKELENKLLTT